MSNDSDKDIVPMGKAIFILLIVISGAVALVGGGIFLGISTLGDKNTQQVAAPKNDGNENLSKSNIGANNNSKSIIVDEEENTGQNISQNETVETNINEVESDEDIQSVNSVGLDVEDENVLDANGDNPDDIVLDSPDNIEKYLNLKYGNKLETALGINDNISYDVTLNDSIKYPYDYDIEICLNDILLSMNIQSNLTNIDKTKQEIARQTENQYKDFIYGIAQDLMAKLPDKKLKGCYRQHETYLATKQYTFTGAVFQEYEVGDSYYSWNNYGKSNLGGNVETYYSVDDLYNAVPAINKFYWDNYTENLSGEDLS